MPPCRARSREDLAGVEPPEALTDGWRLKPPAAAAARSAEACETLPVGIVLVVLPACVWVEAVETPLPDTGAAPFVDAGTLLPLTDDDERSLLEGVGCVGPVIW